MPDDRQKHSRILRERRSTSWPYLWLLCSVFFTVPSFAVLVFNLGYRAGLLERVWTALVPLVFQTPLLLGLLSRAHFVKRHTQQALILAVLRALMAFISLSLGDGLLCLYLPGNGFLWLFGSLWGLSQARRGDCWLMRYLGEDEMLMLSDDAKPQAVVSTEFMPPKPVPRPAASEDGAASADTDGALAVLQRGRSQVAQGRRRAAVTCFMVAFGQGESAVRDAAIVELAALGEVEHF